MMEGITFADGHQTLPSPSSHQQLFIPQLISSDQRCGAELIRATQLWDVRLPEGKILKHMSALVADRCSLTYLWLSDVVNCKYCITAVQVVSCHIKAADTAANIPHLQAQAAQVSAGQNIECRLCYLLHEVHPN